MRYKVMRNFKDGRKLYRQGSFFEVSENANPALLSMVRERLRWGLRWGFIRQLYEDEKPAKKVEQLGTEEKKSKLWKSKKK